MFILCKTYVPLSNFSLKNVVIILRCYYRKIKKCYYWWPLYFYQGNSFYNCRAYFSPYCLPKHPHDTITRYNKNNNSNESPQTPYFWILFPLLFNVAWIWDNPRDIPTGIAPLDSTTGMATVNITVNSIDKKSNNSFKIVFALAQL